MDHLQKTKERLQKFKEKGDTQYIYKNEIDKACFQHDMAYWDLKGLTRRTASDKILCDEAFNIAKKPVNFTIDQWNNFCIIMHCLRNVLKAWWRKICCCWKNY